MRAYFGFYRGIPIGELSNSVSSNKIGKRLFINNCSACHGARGQGSFGFPNLTDSAWSWGGEGEQIETTILNGRNAVMMPWKDILGESGVTDVAEHVLSLAVERLMPTLLQEGRFTFLLSVQPWMVRRARVQFFLVRET